MNTNYIMSQIEINKAIIQRYFDAYNNRNETIFDEIISSDYIDHGQTAYMGSPGRGINGAKNDLRYSLDKLDDLNYVVEDMIASPAYPDLVGTYWKGTLIPKATSNNQQAEKIINYRGISIYRIQNNKMVETWHVVDRPPK
jgi:predicted ester cyclase